MIVSLEAIFLSTFILISQNRADERRQVVADQQWQMVQDEEQQTQELLRLSSQILKLTRAIYSSTTARVRSPHHDRRHLPDTVGDALARRAHTRQRVPSARAAALRELGAVDRAIYDAVARTATATLDGPVRRLSTAADHSRLWLAIAAMIALVGGRRGRRAALEDVVSIGVTSATVNLGAKSLIGATARPGPLPLPAACQVPMPTSTSFPSGHAASAFAFAYAVGRHLPGLAVPVRLPAAGVAYSRVHTGVHYSGDVVAGSLTGAGTAAMVAAIFDRLATRRTTACRPSRPREA